MSMSPDPVTDSSIEGANSTTAHDQPDRERSPPVPVDALPPSVLPLHSLPRGAQRALAAPPSSHHIPPKVLMPLDTVNNVAKSAAPTMETREDTDQEPSRSKDTPQEKDGADGVKAESSDFAYEYVPVVQRREGRKNIRYELTMRQQPVQARMCGVGEKSDRRPVDPTPIVQLKVIDNNGDDAMSGDHANPSKPRLRRPDPGPSGMTFMQNPYYFLFACLVGGDEKEEELHVIDDGKTRFLTGTPVSSLYHLKDTDSSDAAFFVFPDLGVRKEGRYKLKLTLFEIIDQEVYYCTTMYTATFSVYPAKKFPGMSAATKLSESFAEQGLKIRVRKDPRQRKVVKPVSGKRKGSGNESDEERRAAMLKRPRASQPGMGIPQEQAIHPRYSNGPMQRYGDPPQGYHSAYPPPGYGHRMPPPPPPPPQQIHTEAYRGVSHHYHPQQTQQYHPRSHEAYMSSRTAYYPASYGHPSVPWPQTAGQVPPGHPSYPHHHSHPDHLPQHPNRGPPVGPRDHHPADAQYSPHRPRPSSSHRPVSSHFPGPEGDQPIRPNTSHHRQPSQSSSASSSAARPRATYSPAPHSAPSSRDYSTPQSARSFFPSQRPLSREPHSPINLPGLASAVHNGPNDRHPTGPPVTLPPIAHSPYAEPQSVSSTRPRGGRKGPSSVEGLSSGSPATSPGGTKSTNRMGLGHLVD